MPTLFLFNFDYRLIVSVSINRPKFNLHNLFTSDQLDSLNQLIVCVSACLDQNINCIPYPEKIKVHNSPNKNHKNVSEVLLRLFWLINWPKWIINCFFGPSGWYLQKNVESQKTAMTRKFSTFFRIPIRNHGIRFKVRPETEFGTFRLVFRMRTLLRKRLTQSVEFSYGKFHFRINRMWWNVNLTEKRHVNCSILCAKC